MKYTCTFKRTLALLAIPFWSLGQAGIEQPHETFPCRSDAVAQDFVNGLRARGVDSLIVVTDRVDSAGTTDASVTRFLWLESGTGWSQTIKGCDAVVSGEETPRDLHNAFAFYQDNKLYSITTHMWHGNAGCGTACRCSHVTLGIPGEFRSFLVRTCDPLYTDNQIIESNAGIEHDKARMLLQEWVSLLIRH